MGWQNAGSIFAIIMAVLGIIRENANALIPAIVGIVSTLLTYIITTLINEKDRKWRLDEPSIRRKVDIHRDLYKMSSALTISLPYSYGDQRFSTLKIFWSSATYSKWCNEFLDFQTENSILYTAEVLKITYYFDAYRTSLHSLMGIKIDGKADPSKMDNAYRTLGRYVSQDFLIFREDLRAAIRKYLNQRTSERIIEEDAAFLEPAHKDQSLYLEKFDLIKNRSMIEQAIDQAIA